MTANPTLVKEHNIPEQDVLCINKIHDSLELMLSTYTLECDLSSALKLVKQAELTLQQLWGFPEDSRYHTWYKLFKRKHFLLQWVGKKYRCNDTGVVVTISEDINERDTIAVGKGMLDLGVAGGYYRQIGNIEEVQ